MFPRGTLITNGAAHQNGIKLNLPDAEHRKVSNTKQGGRRDTAMRALRKKVEEEDERKRLLRSGEFIEKDARSRRRKWEAAAELLLSQPALLCQCRRQSNCVLVVFWKATCACEHSERPNLLQSHRPQSMPRKHLDFRPFDPAEELFSNTCCKTDIDCSR